MTTTTTYRPLSDEELIWPNAVGQEHRLVQQARRGNALRDAVKYTILALELEGHCVDLERALAAYEGKVDE